MSQFGSAYYKRFYGRGGVHDKKRIGQLATAVHNMCAWWGVTPRSVLDIGAGPGLWRDWYGQHHPKVRVLSTDISEYACTKYGHQQRDIAQWTPPHAFDLVICHGVLQYPNDEDVASAIDNLAQATKQVLYLEIPTANDLATIVDISATDMDVHHREGEWYRSLLDPYFVQAGAGLWVRRGGSIALYELEGGR